MTNTQVLDSALAAAKEVIAEAIAFDAWRSTSFLLQMLHKLDTYCEHLQEANPGADFYSAQVALNTAKKAISSNYNVPTDDDRFEKVRDLYDGVIDLFIDELSDDAVTDLVYLGNLCNYVAEMRVYSWNAYIEKVGPSEGAFNALKLAKRDEKIVEIAVSAAADAIFGD